MEGMWANTHTHTHTHTHTQDEQGKVIGARIRDRASGAETDVYARVVINATGAFADDVRRYSEVSYIKPSILQGQRMVVREQETMRESDVCAWSSTSSALSHMPQLASTQLTNYYSLCTIHTAWSTGNCDGQLMCSHH